MVKQAFADLPNNKLVAILADLVVTYAASEIGYEEYFRERQASCGLIGNALEYALDKLWADKQDELQQYINSIKEDDEYWGPAQIALEQRNVFYIDVGKLDKAEDFMNKLKEFIAKKRGESCC